MPDDPPSDPADALGARLIRAVTDAAWGALGATRHLPAAQPARYGVERVRDVAYASGGAVAHTLDVYRPTRQAPGRALPVVLYLHGGGFRVLSKDSHWALSLAFARRGYLVFTVNYRMAPEHPFPAALEDVCAALVWTHDNAARYGGEPSRIVVAGESAGANLATALAVVTCFERPEPWARRTFDAGIRAAAVLPACGILQVSDVARFTRSGGVSRFIGDRLREVENSYLPGDGGRRELADPLLILEGASGTSRPLPPFFAGVGTRDVLEDDTRRLAAALAARGVVCEARYYEGERHAFHALVWRPGARAFWRDTFRFLDVHVPTPLFPTEAGVR